MTYTKYLHLPVRWTKTAEEVPWRSKYQAHSFDSHTKWEEDTMEKKYVLHM